MNQARWAFAAAALMVSVALGGMLDATTAGRQQHFNPDIPQTWDDAPLAEWATPLAGLNVRPGTISVKEY